MVVFIREWLAQRFRRSQAEHKSRFGDMARMMSSTNRTLQRRRPQFIVPYEKFPYTACEILSITAFFIINIPIITITCIALTFRR